MQEPRFSRLFARDPNTGSTDRPATSATPTTKARNYKYQLVHSDNESEYSNGIFYCNLPHPEVFKQYGLEFERRETGPLVQSATSEHLPPPTKTILDKSDPAVNLRPIYLSPTTHF